MRFSSRIFTRDVYKRQEVRDKGNAEADAGQIQQQVAAAQFDLRHQIQMVLLKQLLPVSYTHLFASVAERNAFSKKAASLILPMALQNLISVGVTATDIILLGKVGETVLSGASLAGQIQFIMTLIFFGVTSGASVLIAQYWGKKDVDAIEKVMGIALKIAVVTGALFTAAALFFSGYLMRIYTAVSYTHLDVYTRQYDDRYHMLKAKMPCLLTALAELNEPRYMTPGGIFEACAKEITVWGRKDLKDVEDSNLGLKGSPTQIAKASDKVRKGKGETVNLDVAESVDYIMNKLQEKHII